MAAETCCITLKPLKFVATVGEQRFEMSALYEALLNSAHGLDPLRRPAYLRPDIGDKLACIVIGTNVISLENLPRQQTLLDILDDYALVNPVITIVWYPGGRLASPRVIGAMNGLIDDMENQRLLDRGFQAMWAQCHVLELKNELCDGLTQLSPEDCAFNLAGRGGCCFVRIKPGGVLARAANDCARMPVKILPENTACLDAALERLEAAVRPQSPDLGAVQRCVEDACTWGAEFLTMGVEHELVAAILREVETFTHEAFFKAVMLSWTFAPLVLVLEVWEKLCTGTVTDVASANRAVINQLSADHVLIPTLLEYFLPAADEQPFGFTKSQFFRVGELTKWLQKLSFRMAKLGATHAEDAVIEKAKQRYARLFARARIDADKLSDVQRAINGLMHLEADTFRFGPTPLGPLWDADHGRVVALEIPRLLALHDKYLQEFTAEKVEIEKTPGSVYAVVNKLRGRISWVLRCYVERAASEESIAG